MSLKRLFPFAVGTFAVLVMVTSLQAGAIFRLEIGPPIAAGSAMGVLKSSKKVVLVVRPLCCDVTSVRITGSAEGMVNGVRQSVPLRLIPVRPAEGVYAVAQEWPADGHWILRLN